MKDFQEEYQKFCDRQVYESAYHAVYHTEAPELDSCRICYKTSWADSDDSEAPGIGDS